MIEELRESVLALISGSMILSGLELTSSAFLHRDNDFGVVIVAAIWNGLCGICPLEAMNLDSSFS